MSYDCNSRREQRKKGEDNKWDVKERRWRVFSWWRLPLFWFVCVCFVLFLFCLSLHLRGGTTSLHTVFMLPQARGVLSSSLWSFLAIRNIFGVFVYLSVFSHFLSFLSFLFLFLHFILCRSFCRSFNVPGFMACVCCACRTQ